MTRRAFRLLPASAALLVAAACADSTTGLKNVEPKAFLNIPGSPGPNVGQADLEYFEVCKTYVGNVGPTVTVNVAVTGSATSNFSVQLANGECKDIWVSGGPDVVTVTEVAVPNYSTSYVREIKTRTGYTTDAAVQGNSASGQVNGNPGTGTLVRFINTYVPPSGEIGDFVWKDSNGNGIQDAGEPGIAGVNVCLSGAATASTTTSSSGAYLFSGLSAGSYTVTICGGVPAGWTPTITGAGTTATDNNGSPANVTLATSSSKDHTIDFGYVEPVAGGCTYTQGYWKTHSTYGPASKPDAGWYNIGVLGPDTPFYNWGKTWYEVFGLAVKGNKDIALAHQYMAAVLNVGTGASAPAAVTAAIAAAHTYFSTGTGDITGLAGILGSYNEGLTGPGHCG